MNQLRDLTGIMECWKVAVIDRSFLWIGLRKSTKT